MKIHDIDLLAMIAKDLRRHGHTVVLANGCFDVLHPGHILHLQAAARMGDCLMVTVTDDEGVRQQKGEGKPIFRCLDRLVQVAALSCVSYVTMNRGGPGYAIGRIKPNVYVKGGEYKGRMTEPLLYEKSVVEKLGGKLAFTDTAEWHSSEIIKKLG